MQCPSLSPLAVVIDKRVKGMDVRRKSSIGGCIFSAALRTSSRNSRVLDRGNRVLVFLQAVFYSSMFDLCGADLAVVARSKFWFERLIRALGRSRGASISTGRAPGAASCLTRLSKIDAMGRIIAFGHNAITVNRTALMSSHLLRTLTHKSRKIRAFCRTLKRLS